MKKHLITSALPYINGVKHLGNLVGSLLPADAYARFLRQQGHEVLSICGTDDHGAPAEIAAQQAGQSVETFTAAMYETQAEIYRQFGLDFDYFGRSSAPSNHEITQQLYLQLKEEGYIYEKNTQQFFSLADNRFLPDRYITGECPHCGFDRARGDQCENCGKLLEPTDLKHPKSTLNADSPLELRETRHLYIALSKLESKLTAWIDSKDHWDKQAKGIARKWMQEGLHDRCITRDLRWGIAVPEAGMDDKVFYVWFDAPNAYISMTKDWAESVGQPDAWQSWWTQSDEVEYTQFMAKDNLPFHIVFWPSMLLGANADYKLADVIKGFNWLNYYGGKFSTSQQHGIFTDTALELFPADYWRFYLMSIAPESADSSFTIEDFANTVNKDLAGGLGNFVNRASTLVKKYFDLRIPDVGHDISLPEDVWHSVNEILQQLESNCRALRFRQCIQDLNRLYSVGNVFISAAEPWKVAKTDLNACGLILGQCLYLMMIFAVASHPFVPHISDQIARLFGADFKPGEVSLSQLRSQNRLPFPAGHPIIEIGILVNRIPAEIVEELKQRFGSDKG